MVLKQGYSTNIFLPLLNIGKKLITLNRSNDRHRHKKTTINWNIADMDP